MMKGEMRSAENDTTKLTKIDFFAHSMSDGNFQVLNLVCSISKSEKKVRFF